MTDITPAPAASPVAPALTIPVPPEAKPPTTDAKPAEPVAAPETANADPDKQAGEQKDDQPRNEDGTYKPKLSAKDRKSQIRDEIDQLTYTKRSTEREVQRLREEAQRLYQQIQQQPAQSDDPLDPTHAVRKAVREDRLEQTVTQAKAAEAAAAEARARMFDTRIKEAREAIPDLDTSLDAFFEQDLSEFAADLIAESDKCAEIANYLGKNPAEMARIYRLPPHLQGAAIARIEARVSTAPQARRTSNAPPPPPQINGSSAPAAKTVAEMSVDDLKGVIYGARA